MKKALYLATGVALFVCLIFSFERPAMAYVDPGSGLFLFQSVSSIGVGVLFFLRRRLKTLFWRSKPVPTDPALDLPQEKPVELPRAA